VVANYGTQGAPGSTLTLIDVAEAKVLDTIDLGTHRRPHGIAWLPDGRRVAVTAEESKALLLVDADDARVLSTIGTGQDVSHMVQLSSDGRRAYVANIGSGSISVLDLAAGAQAKTIPTGAGAEGIALTPSGRELWVTNREADTLSVIDTRKLEIVKTLPSASFPIRTAVTVDGRSVLVSNARSGEVALFDAHSKIERRRLAMKLDAASAEGRLFGDQFGASPVPIGIQVHPDGRRAYVANAHADVVAIIDLERFAVIGVLRAGKEPDGMAYSPFQVRTPGTSGKEAKTPGS